MKNNDSAKNYSARFNNLLFELNNVRFGVYRMGLHYTSLALETCSYSYIVFVSLRGDKRLSLRVN